MNPRVLWVLSRPGESRLERTMRGLEPSELLYGLPALKARRWHIDVTHWQLQGSMQAYLRPLAARLQRSGINVVDHRVTTALRSYDLVVVKDELSVQAVLKARQSRVPIVFVDSLFHLPRDPLRTRLFRWCIRHSSRVVGFSSTQRELWESTLRLPEHRLATVPFGIDVSFYRCPPPAANREAPYVLAVGRDPGRDYDTLLRALPQTGVRAKIVAPSYLLPERVNADPRVDVFEGIPYATLFELYAGASAVVVPLRAGITYPSGIRGLLEAMVMGRPTIAARTPCLLEYASGDEHVAYYEAEEPASLRHALDDVLTRPDHAETRARSAARHVREHFTVEHMTDAIEQVMIEALHAR